MAPALKILSLFDRSGVMVKPWHDNGHEILTVDLAPAEHNMRSCQVDLDYPENWRWFLEGWDIIFAFPPCDDLASSGARWWASKGPPALRSALDRARRVWLCDSKLTVIENPIGRLRHASGFGQPTFKFHPYEFAGYTPEDVSQRYQKTTCLWCRGDWREPAKKPLPPTADGKKRIHHMSSKQRKLDGTVTPKGFAIAIYEAHKDIK